MYYEKEIINNGIKVNRIKLNWGFSYKTLKIPFGSISNYYYSPRLQTTKWNAGIFQT